MTTTLDTLFAGLPAPDALPGFVETASLRTNAHIHLPPNFSAFETVAQAVTLAEKQDIAILGASNYYDYGVYGEFARQAREQNVFPLFGTEIITLDDDLVAAGIKVNDPGNPGRMYVCGKAITRFEAPTPEATKLLNAIRTRDAERMEQVTQALTRVFTDAGFDTGLSVATIKAGIVARHGSPLETIFLQERHIAQAFQQAIFERVGETERAVLFTRVFGGTVNTHDANAVQAAIRTHLMKAGKPAFVPETFVGWDHARRLILALNGIPCYPTLGDGTQPLCAFEETPDVLLANLQAYGFTCAEWIPLRNTPEVLERYVVALRAAGIIVTAGTEHNTRDLVPLEPTCVGGVPIPENVQAIFREGALVIAAHQYLGYHNETGFVDANGTPNPAYPSAEARIAAFADLGERVVAAYRQQG